MTTFQNYADPIIPSGHAVSFGQVGAGFGDVNAFGINNIRDILVAAGWSNPGSEGVPATGEIIGLGIPFHNGGAGGPSQVPINGTRMGFYDGFAFVLYDPLASPPDTNPTGNIDISGLTIIGVALSTSANGTIGNFNFLASFNTRWNFNLGPQDPVTNISLGVVTAYLNGPTGNVDASDIFGFFGGDGANVFVVTSPTLGGWNLYTDNAPVTGDSIKLYVYQGIFGNLRIRATLGGSGSGSSGTFVGGTLTQEYPLLFFNYHLIGGRFQFALQPEPGQTGVPGDFAGLLGGGAFAMCAALSVPTEFTPQVLNILSITNGTGVVVIQTDVPHGQIFGDRIKISGVAGGAMLNDYWWVLGAPTADTMHISHNNSTLLNGDGTGGTGGHVTCNGIMQASFFTGDLADRLNTKDKTQIQCQGISKTSWDSPRTASGDLGIMLPVVNIGTESAAAVNSSNKPLLQAPYVMMRLDDDQEARIAGFLWDAHVRLEAATYTQQVNFGGSYHMAWGNDDRIGKMVAASYWFKI